MKNLEQNSTIDLEKNEIKIRVNSNGYQVIGIEFIDKLVNKSTDCSILLKFKTQFFEYIDGARKEFNIPYFYEGTEFQRKCWETLTKIPYGKTISYKEQAKFINNPKSAQAVGQANKKNPLPILIPCHRVVKQDGGLGGYSGKEDNPIKKFLLNLETN